MNEEQKHPGDLSQSQAVVRKNPGRQKAGSTAGRTILLTVLALALLAAAVGGGYFYWRQQAAGAEKTAGAEQAAGETSAYKTTTVRRSDLSISISGSGTVVPVQTADLAFSVEGTVGALNVAVGDEVTAGQELASLSLSDVAALKQEILDQQLAVKVAERTLADLQSGASAALAQAKADQAAAEEAYAEAQANAHSAGDARCAQSLTRDYYLAYLDAQKDVDIWEGYLNDPNTGYGYDYLIQKLTPMRRERDQAYYNYTYCQGYTEKEIEASQAALQLARAKLDQANADYEAVTANTGVDPVDLAIAEATLKSAQLALSSAEDELAGSVITAPIDGTVTAVNGKVGEELGSGTQNNPSSLPITQVGGGDFFASLASEETTSITFITITNMEAPQIEVHIDEIDLQNFAVGCAAQVTFDSLPGQAFEGTVTQVSPVLVAVNSASMVEGMVALAREQTADRALSVGMTASVEVTCKQSKNALIVPAQALYEPEGQPAYVYILDDSGQPQKREVEVGLSTIASAEITGGLSEGEKVITSQVEAVE